jgi:hypothetical protein
MKNSEEDELENEMIAIRDTPLFKEICEYLFTRPGPQMLSKMVKELEDPNERGKSKSNIYSREKKIRGRGLIKERKINSRIYVELTDLGKKAFDLYKKERKSYPSNTKALNMKDKMKVHENSEEELQ